MKQEQVKREYQEKKTGKYITTFTDTDELTVYQELAQRLIAKKINGCKWITTIRRNNLYNGYSKIIITYDNGGRDVFTVKD